MSASEAPALAGVHHLKLPVTDLARSLEWYRGRLGYDVEIEFVEQGVLMGYAMAHPNGGPRLALPLDPAWQGAIRTNLEVNLRLAAAFADFPLPDDAEPAPVFAA